MCSNLDLATEEVRRPARKTVVAAADVEEEERAEGEGAWSLLRRTAKRKVRGRRGSSVVCETATDVEEGDAAAVREGDAAADVEEDGAAALGGTVLRPELGQVGRRRAAIARVRGEGGDRGGERLVGSGAWPVSEREVVCS